MSASSTLYSFQLWALSWTSRFALNHSNLEIGAYYPRIRRQAVDADHNHGCLDCKLESRSALLHQFMAVPTGEIIVRDLTGGVNEGFQSVAKLTQVHDEKIYESGPLTIKHESNAVGQNVKWTGVWAELEGVILRMWDMDRPVSVFTNRPEESKDPEALPTCINITDVYVQIQDSISTETPTSTEQTHTNVLVLNFVGYGRILATCATPELLNSWAMAIHLSAWERSRIQEVYTGHLFRSPMYPWRALGPVLKSRPVEGWAQVRIGNEGKWKRLWVVVSMSAASIYAEQSASSSRRLSKLPGFLTARRASFPDDKFGASSTLGGPVIALYSSNKAKERKRLVHTLFEVSQAFSVYPNDPDRINETGLFNIEATIKEEHSAAKTSIETRREHVAFAVEGSGGKAASWVMLRWLFAIHDAFGLYGWPVSHSWDHTDARSLFFAYDINGPPECFSSLSLRDVEVPHSRIGAASDIRDHFKGVLSQHMLQRRSESSQEGMVESPVLLTPQTPPFNPDDFGEVTVVSPEGVTLDPSTLGGASQPQLMSIIKRPALSLPSIPEGEPFAIEFTPYQGTDTPSSLDHQNVSSSADTLVEHDVYGGIIEEGEERDDIISYYAQSDGTGQTLEILMARYAPVDLTGQVTIPDYRNPAHGGLADVHLGLLHDNSVAVKILRLRKSQQTDSHWGGSNERRIRREMNVWAALKHRNICEFLGYVTNLSDYPAMISKWCQRGTASEHLKRHNLSVKKRLILAQDVGDGLQYLHQLKVIHGDLKPSNILVDDDCVARLCDFGLVTLADWQGASGMTTTSAYTGTPRYKAPELFVTEHNRHPVATFEGDIFSLGCIMLEFVERIPPFRRFKPPRQLGDAIMDGLAPALRSESNDALSEYTDFFWNLLEACWSDKAGRPVVGDIVEALDYFARPESPGHPLGPVL